MDTASCSHSTSLGHPKMDPVFGVQQLVLAQGPLFLRQPSFSLLGSEKQVKFMSLKDVDEEGSFDAGKRERFPARVKVRDTLGRNHCQGKSIESGQHRRTEGDSFL